MSSVLTDPVCTLLKELISNITGLDAATKQFHKQFELSKRIMTNPDYFFTQNRQEIETKVRNLCEKFEFQGFMQQASELESLTKQFLDSSTCKDDLNTRVALVKLLLDLSRSPGRVLLENPLQFRTEMEHKPETEMIDWAAYLNDDTKFKLVETCPDDEDSDNWSNCSEEQVDYSTQATQIEIETETKTEPDLIQNVFKLNQNEQRSKSRMVLKNMLQSDWWGQEFVQIRPQTLHREANITFDWDNYVEDASMGLLKQKTKIISEYSIVREIIWQFYQPHFSSVFEFDLNNQLKPRHGISISSVRAHVLTNFLNEFIPYIHMLKTFRDFQARLKQEYFVVSVPDTYRSYSYALEQVIRPIYNKLEDIEVTIRKQDAPFTLLKLAHEVRPLFKDLELLHQIHTDVIILDSDETSALQKSTRLLSRLYYGLLNSSNKTEQNLYLTLYLESLYKYFATIEIWLTQDYINDLSDEFIILQKTNTNPTTTTTVESGHEWQTEYVPRELDQFSQMDGMLSTITTKLIPLTKNIHLLRLLNKLHLIQSDTKQSLHAEFIQKILTEARRYVTTTTNEQQNIEIIKEREKVVEILRICPDVKQSETGIDSIEHFRHTSDLFLRSVFGSAYFCPEANDVTEHNKTKSKSKSLFQKINESLTKLFPAKQILERTFLNILDERYSVPGLMVKNLLMQQFRLTEYFGWMRHLYLFQDDVIFPLYRQMFYRFEGREKWGNFFWLTSQLQDLFMDLYPDLYETCRIEVSPNWHLCTNPLVAYSLVSVHCRITWPVNIIIRKQHIQMYQDVFQFILKLKWALTTLNHLILSELESRYKRLTVRVPIVKRRKRKLELLRFALLNDVASIQHYLLGHLASGVQSKFECDLDGTYDLESMYRAHHAFITTIHQFCTRMCQQSTKEYGYDQILVLVHKLSDMWSNLTTLDDSMLEMCQQDYYKCHKFLKPIIEYNIVQY